MINPFLKKTINQIELIFSGILFEERSKWNAIINNLAPNRPMPPQQESESINGFIEFIKNNISSEDINDYFDKSNINNILQAIYSTDFSFIKNRLELQEIITPILKTNYDVYKIALEYSLNTTKENKEDFSEENNKIFKQLINIGIHSGQIKKIPEHTMYTGNTEKQKILNELLGDKEFSIQEYLKILSNYLSLMSPNQTQKNQILQFTNINFNHIYEFYKTQKLPQNNTFDLTGNITPPDLKQKNHFPPSFFLLIAENNNNLFPEERILFLKEWIANNDANAFLNENNYIILKALNNNPKIIPWCFEHVTNNYSEYLNETDAFHTNLNLYAWEKGDGLIKLIKTIYHSNKIPVDDSYKIINNLMKLENENIQKDFFGIILNKLTSHLATQIQNNQDISSEIKKEHLIKLMNSYLKHPEHFFSGFPTLKKDNTYYNFSYYSEFSKETNQNIETFKRFKKELKIPEKFLTEIELIKQDEANKILEAFCLKCKNNFNDSTETKEIINSLINLNTVNQIKSCNLLTEKFYRRIDKTYKNNGKTITKRLFIPDFPIIFELILEDHTGKILKTALDTPALYQEIKNTKVKRKSFIEYALINNPEKKNIILTLIAENQLAYKDLILEDKRVKNIIIKNNNEHDMKTLKYFEINDKISTKEDNTQKIKI